MSSTGELIRTRFLIISDNHSAVPEDATDDDSTAFRPPLPDADVVLHCGDMTKIGNMDEYEKTIRMLGNIKAELKLVIAGNHDITLDSEFCRQHEALDESDHARAMDMMTGPLAKEMGITYLQEGMHSFTLSNGSAFTVYASPYQPGEFKNAWGFQYKTDQDRFNPPQHSVPWAKSVATNPIPSFPDVDIMMTHGPPKYLLDECNAGNFGCEHLLSALCRAKPRLHCFGHVHSAFGAQILSWHRPGPRNSKSPIGHEAPQNYDRYPPEPVFRGSMRKKRCVYKDMTGVAHGKATLLVNASIMDQNHEPSNAPWLVDLDLPVSQSVEAGE